MKSGVPAALPHTTTPAEEEGMRPQGGGETCEIVQQGHLGGLTSRVKERQRVMNIW